MNICINQKNGKKLCEVKTNFNNAFTLVELIVVISILAILGTISFIALQGFAMDARDVKRISDVRNLQSKINMENIKGVSYSELLTGTIQTNIIIDRKIATGYIGTANFETLKENQTSFQDPIYQDKYKDYKIAYAIGTTNEGIKYNFLQLAYKQETTNTIKCIGNYYKIQEGDAENLFEGTDWECENKGNNGDGGGLPAQTYSCENQTNIILENVNTSNTTGLTQDIPYQSTDSGNPCYYTCKTTHTGEKCDSRLVYGDGLLGEPAEAIVACNEWVKQAIGNNAGGYENWIWVPARYFETDGQGIALSDDFYKREIIYNQTSYTCNGFAVMKYEAKFLTDQRLEHDTWKTRTCNNYIEDDDIFCTTLKIETGTGDIGSLAANYPVVGARQGEAIYACKGLSYSGSESHLITNNERMAITRNIEQQTNNWSSGVIGDGYLYVGQTDHPQTLQASNDDSNGYYGTNDGISVNDNYYSRYLNSGIELSYKGQKRTLILSNGQAIWDLSGNVWEHVNKSNIPITNNDRNSNNGWNSSTYRLANACSNNTSGNWTWYGYNADSGVGGSAGDQDSATNGDTLACNFYNGYTYENIGPSIAGLNASNGIGRIIGRNATGGNVWARGGNAHYGINAGIFALSIGMYPNDITSWYDLGFRCSL